MTAAELLDKMLARLAADTTPGVFQNAAWQHYWNGQVDTVAAALADTRGIDGNLAREHVMDTLHHAHPDLI